MSHIGTCLLYRSSHANYAALSETVRYSVARSIVVPKRHQLTHHVTEMQLSSQLYMHSSQESILSFIFTYYFIYIFNIIAVYPSIRVALILWINFNGRKEEHQMKQFSLHPVMPGDVSFQRCRALEN